MCGIAGIIGTPYPSAQQPEILKRMLEIQHHRGPDGRGAVHWNDELALLTATPASCFVSFGHNRLAIIDLSVAGHQPMTTPDEQLWITYNGEIYNYIELRQNLEYFGHQFKTATDTEVILAAYRQWGVHCLDMFNGMFSFAILDVPKKTFWAARDRTGVKPFYYTTDPRHFSFASEQKTLWLTMPEEKRQINKPLVHDFLVAGKMDHTTESMFTGIKELPAGHTLTIPLYHSSIQPEIKRWYHPKVNHNHSTYQADRIPLYAEQIKGVFTDAVRLRLRSDVPVGSCLSGGLDSSAVVSTIAALRQHTPVPAIRGAQKVFTAGFDDTRFDERQWAKLVVDATHAEWHQVSPGPSDVICELAYMMYAQDEPTLSLSTFSQFSVMKLAARQGVKVLLDGQGGDELFSGYVHHGWQYAHDLKKYYPHLNTKQHQQYAPGFRQVVKSQLLPRLPASMQRNVLSRTHPEWQYLHPDLRSAFPERQNTPSTEHFEDLNAMLADEYFGPHLKLLLRCEDRNSMWFSIESRTPFADDTDLMEAMFSIPGVYKMNDGFKKNLLREAMRGVVPEPIRLRTDKMGFATPTHPWLSDIKNEMRSFFTEDMAEFFDMPKLMKDYDKLFTPQSAHENYRIYKFIAFAVWYSVFFRNDFKDK